jgi:hypothetical protein
LEVLTSAGLTTCMVKASGQTFGFHFFPTQINSSIKDIFIFAAFMVNFFFLFRIIHFSISFAYTVLCTVGIDQKDFCTSQSS